MSAGDTSDRAEIWITDSMGPCVDLKLFLSFLVQKAAPIFITIRSVQWLLAFSRQYIASANLGFTNIVTPHPVKLHRCTGSMMLLACQPVPNGFLMIQGSSYVLQNAFLGNFKKCAILIMKKLIGSNIPTAAFLYNL
jgi:hypothetical protein